MRRSLVAIGAVTAVVAAACGGHRSAAPPPPTVVASTTTTTTPDPTVVPPVITAAYLDAVFARLNHVYGDAVRELVQARSVDPRVQTLLRAIYADPQYQYELNVFQQGLASSLAQLRPNPGDPVFSLVRWRLSDGCIETTVLVNPDAQLIQPVTPVQAFIDLKAGTGSHDPGHLNRTNWSISYERNTPPPGESCA